MVYSYDPMGRTKDFWQCNPSNCGASSIWSTQYNYDQAGDITSWVHPGGFTLTNTVNAAQQVTAIQSSWVDSNHPQYLAQSISYTPWGAVSQLANGCAGSSCTNAQETYAYNKQLQPAIIELGTTSNATADYCLVYNYYGTSPTSCALPSPGTNNNGNVMGYWYQDSVNSSFSHTASYTYDGVKRLATAVATGNATYNLTFKYDAYGNMTCVTNAQTNGPCPNWAYNTSTNQLSTSGFSYDAAGNLTKDSSNPTAHTYQWDAEGRVASVDSGSTWGFTYNALADRAQWAYTGGADQHLFDPAGTWLGNAGSYSLVGLGGQYLALYLGGDTLFNHINALGSASMRTNHSGAEAEDILFYPWGDVWGLQGSGGYNFAEMPYNDTNTNTNLATFRLQSPGLGRWLSPDPLGGRITNPQSLNRYAYGLNNPTTLVDPLGLGPCGPMSAQIAKSTGKTADCVGDPSSSGGGGSCDPLNDPTCPCDPNDPNCSYPCIPEIDPFCNAPTGGGGGGGPGGGGGGGTPPLGGMGNAGFGGLITCTQVTVVVNGVPYPSGPLQCTLNLPPWLLPFLQRPWVLSWIVPVVQIIPDVGVGPAGSFAFNPSTHTACASLGVGASAGRNVAAGPILEAKSLNGVPLSPKGVTQILRGWSTSAGYNDVSGAGLSGIVNGAGWAVGPTFGIPGGSLAVANSACISLY